MKKEDKYTNAEILVIARKRKAILWLSFIIIVMCIFVHPINIMNDEISVGATLLWLVFDIVAIAIVSQFVEALKRSDAWAWCLGMIIPISGLFLLICLNVMARRAIRDKGVEFGFMGVKKAQLDMLFQKDKMLTESKQPPSGMAL
jgi:hypothetical protein